MRARRVLLAVAAGVLFLGAAHGLMTALHLYALKRTLEAICL